MAGTFLYVGGFLLPHGNAAAQRVLANAKLFCECGYKVVFINYSSDSNCFRRREYDGFECYEYCARSKLKALFDIDDVYEVVAKTPDIKAIIAYNMPSIALARLLMFCKARKIKCIGDITEWYSGNNRGLVHGIVKRIDSFARMRVLNHRCDALIVISEYLKQSYPNSKTLLLPPLVDKKDAKWDLVKSAPSDELATFVYAGSPSKEKERLDLVISAIDDQEANCRLNIVGITKEQFGEIYPDAPTPSKRVVFYGKLDHAEALRLVKEADYSLIIRDDNRTTRVGFPTKFVESIACGTPVICTDTSDLSKYANGISVTVAEMSELSNVVGNAMSRKAKVEERWVFDCRRYVNHTSKVLSLVLVEQSREEKL